jgi:beta-glucanase (GH16 family)
MWPPEIDMVENTGGDGFTMTYHYVNSDGVDDFCQTSNTYSGVDLENFNVFEFTWSPTELSLYADDSSSPVLTLSTTSGPCDGVTFPHEMMNFDFQQQNYTGIGVSNQQTSLAWVSQWST